MNIHPPSHSRQVSETLVKFMPEGFLAVDESGHITTYNESAVRILGFPVATDLSGKHIGSIYSSKEETEGFFKVFREMDRFDNRECTFVKADGSRFLGSYCGLHIVDENTSENIKVVIFRDTTGKKAAEQKLSDYTLRLEKSVKELDHFAYVVSHDLKAPLRAISNLSLWLYEDLESSLTDENKTNLVMLRGRVARMEALINGILEYSKVGRVALTFDNIDVYQLLNEVLEMLNPPAHVRVEVSADMPVMQAPKVMLLQVFSNLISNAIKYNDKVEVLIAIDCEERTDCFVFSIQDNGPGIAPEFHEKIFVIFQTLQSRDKFESTGIGLTIVKRILEECGGRIWLESEPGKGSRFIFTWPKQNGQQLQNSL